MVKVGFMRKMSKTLIMSNFGIEHGLSTFKCLLIIIYLSYYSANTKCIQDTIHQQTFHWCYNWYHIPVLILFKCVNIPVSKMSIV
jgi:hypothetical protein